MVAALVLLGCAILEGTSCFQSMTDVGKAGFSGSRFLHRVRRHELSQAQLSSAEVEKRKYFDGGRPTLCAVSNGLLNDFMSCRLLYCAAWLVSSPVRGCEDY